MSTKISELTELTDFSSEFNLGVFDSNNKGYRIPSSAFEVVSTTTSPYLNARDITDIYSFEDLYNFMAAGEYSKIRISDSIVGTDDNNYKYLLMICGIDTHVGCIMNSNRDRIKHNIDFVLTRGNTIKIDFEVNGTATEPHPALTSEGANTVITASLEDLIEKFDPDGIYFTDIYDILEQRYSESGTSTTYTEFDEDYLWSNVGKIRVLDEVSVLGAAYLSNSYVERTHFKYPIFKSTNHIAEYYLNTCGSAIPLLSIKDGSSYATYIANTSNGTYVCYTWSSSTTVYPCAILRMAIAQ